jgi:hypothetical protein
MNPWLVTRQAANTHLECLWCDACLVLLHLLELHLSPLMQLVQDTLSITLQELKELAPLRHLCWGGGTQHSKQGEGGPAQQANSQPTLGVVLRSSKSVAMP